MSKCKLIVINVAGLSPALVKRGDLLPNISSIIADGSYLPLYPVFPAVTCTVQATLTTGTYPSEHGIVANGLFERDSMEVHFWHQPNQLVQKERFWTKLRGSGLEKVAMLFWQHSKFSDAEFVNTPAPIHTETGEVISTCYSKPDGLYAELEKLLGLFPLHRYWGPIASAESSQWITKATNHVLKKYTPDLTLTYIPHLDYSLQRFGPKGKEIAGDLTLLDTMIGEIAETAKKIGANIVILSEYGMSEVNDAIHINRELRKAGLLNTFEAKGREYVEIGDCKTFAIADHQIAHIYLNKIDSKEAAAVIRDINPQIRILATDEEKREYHINHERSGDIIAIAPSDKWFTYYWWLDDAKAPTFARGVDIHRKPGYDPLDLFFAPDKKGISMDARMIKGSHGRLPDSKDEMGVFISNLPINALKGKDTIKAIEVANLLETLLK